jgi:RHS repeat-associated protein
LSGEVTGSVARTYGEAFRSNQITVNDADPVAFGYDKDGQLRTAGGLTISRDATTGRPTGTTLGGVTDTWTYTAIGEVESYQARYNGAAIFSHAYTRDKLGRAVNIVETINGGAQTFDYEYDEAARLREVKKDGAVTSTYAYDLNGNRTKHTSGGAMTMATYDDQDRLQTYGAATYAFNEEGDLETKTVNASVTSYSYDALGNLVSASLPDGTAIAYLIDGRNRRVGKKVNGTLVQGFLYQDELNPVAELDGASNVVARFVYATRGHVPDYMVKSGVTYRIISDLLGSPRLVVNVATGDIAQRIDYAEFGNIVLDTNPGFQPFGFGGGIQDMHTGLIRFGARDYDPETGRWTAKDPLRFGGGNSSLYTYVANDPINMVDPSGLLSQKQCEIIREILRHEDAFGTWFTAREFSNTIGKNPMGDLFDNKPVDTVLGTIDIDWFTDLYYYRPQTPTAAALTPFLGSIAAEAVDIVTLYIGGKVYWNYQTLKDGTREAFVWPFQDPKERITMLAFLLGYDSYRSLFPESFLDDECRETCEQSN